MANKRNWLAIPVLALVFGMTGMAAFAHEEKHQSSDVLIGLNFGIGATPNISDILRIKEEKIPQGNYALISDFGLTGDFYLFNWLSFNTGLLLHPDLYVLLDQDLDTDKSFTDIAATPLCLTIPLAVHINIPKVEWLYMGMGLSLNFPIKSLLDPVVEDVDTKGAFFVGLPIDLGFDFVRAGGGGARFFFRVTPEFHEHGTTMPIGFIWQVWNWKVHGRKDRSSEAEKGIETTNTTRADAKAEKKPSDTKAAPVSAERNNTRYRAALDALNAARSKLEKAEISIAEAEESLIAAKEAVALAEADLARAAAALSAPEGR